MGAIRALTNQETLSTKRNICMTVAEKELEHNKLLQMKFLECSGVEEPALSHDVKLTVYKQIWKKAFHARAGVEVRIMKEKTTSRYAKGTSNLAFRATLDAGSKSGSVAKRIAFEETAAK